MIKVNLLKTNRENKAKTKIGTFTQLKMPGGESGSKAVVSRFLILLAPVILGYGFGYYNTGALNSEIVEITKQVAATDKEMESLQPELNKIQELEQNKTKLTEEIGFIRSISKKRYNLPKVLSGIQNLIPEKVWLVKLDFKNAGVTLEGRSPDDQVVSGFMQNLEQNPLFSNVSWLDSREVNEPQGIVKLFNIQLNIEGN